MTAIIILSVLLGVSIFANINLIRKIEIFEDSSDEYVESISSQEKFILDLRTKVNEVYERMTEIDHKGWFKSDDEVGFCFEELKNLMSELNEASIYTTKDLGEPTGEETKE